MADLENPALKHFIAQIGTELVFAQVLIRRSDGNYHLRHVEDREQLAESLRELRLPEVRSWAQHTEAGAFRPLKSAPNLKRGWRLVVADAEGLGMALDAFYPGAIADWHAVRAGNPSVTDFREFTGRQSGMYRITAMLNDAQAGRVIEACCNRKFCLKQRLWTVAGLGADSVETKSLIPCLEPCAVFMEFARKAMRMEQQEKLRWDLAPDEVKTLEAVLKEGVNQTDASLREGDVGAANNPRRIQLVLEKLKPLLTLTNRDNDV
ncbi:DR2241 family protein [Pedosphaera parvula]|uniref:Uncharacterized protein n=1 Tax=Pedosphaera parvula (strain Ellin514) TaxID=320771 RepID=B9XPQ2_PEDPL|nr:DR2241 family protein [Pedosphaera parvula]EEF58175.1 conserved hypothetical protein [Pedosphaera parvula Ellin514]